MFIEALLMGQNNKGNVEIEEGTFEMPPNQVSYPIPVQMTDYDYLECYPFDETMEKYTNMGHWELRIKYYAWGKVYDNIQGADIYVDSNGNGPAFGQLIDKNAYQGKVGKIVNRKNKAGLWHYKAIKFK